MSRGPLRASSYDWRPLRVVSLESWSNTPDERGWLLDRLVSPLRLVLPLRVESGVGRVALLLDRGWSLVDFDLLVLELEGVESLDLALVPCVVSSSDDGLLEEGVVLLDDD